MLSRLLTLLARTRLRPPRIELVPDGIAIVLRADRTVLIPFGDIDELKTLGEAEARQYGEYKVGPHVTLSMEETRQLTGFFNGEIARPAVLHRVGRGATALLIRGHNLLYVIATGTGDADAVMNAYAAFRVRAPRPLRGAAAPPSPFARSGASPR